MTTVDHSSAEAARRSQVEQANAAWAPFLAGLTPAARRLLKKSRIAGPTKDTHKISGHSPAESRDAAELPQASCHIDLGEIDTLEDKLCQDFGLGREEAASIARWHLGEVTAANQLSKARQIARLVGPLISEPNPKVSIAGLAYATNMNELNGLGSLRDYAKSIGVSPEAVSKKKRQWESDLDLQPGPHSKSARARRALSEAQKTNHWRGRKYGRPKSN
jgi:hypothetical protein